MKRKVNISRIAEHKLEKLFEYLVENWSLTVKFDFTTKLDENISLIQKNPESFPVSGAGDGIRKCVITKHTSLYFKFTENEIFILTIFDNRQDPDKLNSEI